MCWPGHSAHASTHTTGLHHPRAFGRRKLLASYAHWGPDWEKNGVDFRAPKKSKGGKMGRA